MSVFDTEDDSVQQPKQPNQHTTKTWADYQKLRRENPHQYYRPSVQAKMHRDAAKLGKEVFFKSSKPADWWDV